MTRTYKKYRLSKKYRLIKLKSICSKYPDMTVQQISKELNVSRKTVLKYLKKLGLSNPDSHKIKQRTQDIVSMRIKNPCATLKQIGDKFGITRERVRQILNKNKLDTHHLCYPKHRCNNCGKPTNHKLFCSKKCKLEFSKATLICDQCGITFERRVYNMKGNIIRNHSKNTFCSRRCLGLWMFDHAKRYSASKKHNTIWSKHLETGLGLVKLSKLLNISKYTISHVLSKKRKESYELIDNTDLYDLENIFDESLY